MEIARESRSRSRTPFLGDAVNTDMTSNVEGSARVTRRTDKPKPTNGLTNGGQEKTETVTTGTETVTVIETKAAKDIVNRNKAKPASKKLLQKEVSKIVEKDIDMKKTVHKEEKTEKKKSTSRKLPMDMGDYSSDEEAKMRTVTAYRAAGEWWEAFPKTDYTYSPASLHRQQQVAPGVKALPNMSRRSLASVAGKHDSSAFVSSTATSFSARKATTDGATPPLPYMSHWKGGRWHTFGQLSDGESDAEDERAFASSTRTETTTTTTTAVSVWTTITTTVISLLVLADPRRALNWALDYLYLVLAYVRVLDARILNALPARPRKAVLVPLLLLPLFLLCALWLATHLGDAPLDAISALIVQSLAPLGAFWANHESAWSLGSVAWKEAANEEAAAAGTVELEATAAEPVAWSQQPGQRAGCVSCPSADVSELTARLLESPGLLAWLARQRAADGADIQRRLDASADAQRLALASAQQRQGVELQQAVEHVGKEVRAEADSWRQGTLSDWSARLEVWTNQVAASVLASQSVQDVVDVDRLLANEKLTAWARANQQPAEDPRVTELLAKMAELQVAVETARRRIVALQQAPSDGGVGADVEAVVAAMLARYDADKTGRADFALESLGGSVLSTRCSETHGTTAASLTLLGFTLWTQPTSPRLAIQPGTLPGQCWAFKGARGFLVVQLSSLVRVSAVSIEHTARALTRNDRIDSAPRRMRLLGLVALEDPEPVDLGSFEYSEHGPSLQTFPLKVSEEIPAFRIVELQIESNHGNQEYTCLYRLRVHGDHVDD